MASRRPLVINDGVIERLQSSDSLDAGLPDGSAAAPGLYFTADADSGVYRISDDVVGVAAGGVGQLAVSATGVSVGGTLTADRGSTGETTTVSFSRIDTNTSSGTKALFKNYAEANPAAASAATHAAFWNLVATAGSQNFTGTVSGSYYEAVHLGSGTCANLIGLNLFSKTYAGAGAVTRRCGAYITMASDAGTSTENAYGIVVAAAEAGTITGNYYAFKATATGAVGTSAGSYLSNNGNVAICTHGNTNYRSALGFQSTSGRPFLALHAEHSSAANTYRNDGAGFKGFVLQHNQAATGGVDFVFNGAATAGVDFSSAVTAMTVRSDGCVLLPNDGGRAYFGAGADASVYYDGTNLIINPKEVGSGILDVAGTLQTDGYNAADGTAGATADVDVAKVGGGTRTLHFKNGLYTGYTDS